MSEATTLKVRVIPGARRDEVDGWHGDAVKIRCRAPALEGRANEAVTALLAARLGVRRADVLLVRGAASRNKVVQIQGLTAAVAYQRLGLDQSR